MITKADMDGQKKNWMEETRTSSETLNKKTSKIPFKNNATKNNQHKRLNSTNFFDLLTLKWMVYHNKVGTVGNRQSMMYNMSIMRMSTTVIMVM